MRRQLFFQHSLEKSTMKRRSRPRRKLTVRYFSPMELRKGTLSSGKHLKNCRTLAKIETSSEQFSSKFTTHLFGFETRRTPGVFFQCTAGIFIAVRWTRVWRKHDDSGEDQWRVGSNSNKWKERHHWSVCMSHCVMFGGKEKRKRDEGGGEGGGEGDKSLSSFIEQNERLCMSS